MDWDSQGLKPANIYSIEITPVSKDTQACKCLLDQGPRLSSALK